MEKATTVEVGPKAEVVQQMKNCCSTSTHRSWTESSSFAPWTIFATTTVAYLSRGAHTTPCISGQAPQVAFTLIH